MGTLIAMAYPTAYFLKLADHTFVKCGTGAKCWPCYGGCQGDGEHQIVAGPGSTQYADNIAGPDGHAGINTYLINGVCHQTANRILYPASLLVTEARGYALSSLVYGTYGKTPTSFSSYLEDKYSIADLAECAQPPLVKAMSKLVAQENPYVKGVMNLYANQAKPERSTFIEDHKGLQDVLFEDLDMLVHYKLADSYKEEYTTKLSELRNAFHGTLALKRGIGGKYMQFISNDIIKASAKELADMTNTDLETLQDEALKILGSANFIKLFGLSNDTERIHLIDPDILAREMGGK